MSEAWIRALDFAALPGAMKVRFERRFVIEDGIRTTRYRLQSEAQDGTLIGDDRDYDVLKAAMTPLEKLADQHGHEDLSVEFDLKTKALRGLDQG